MVVAVTDSARTFMAPRIQAATPGRARLRAYIESNLEFMAADRQGIVALLEIFNALPRGREGQPGHYADPYQVVVAQLEDHLRAGQRCGELRAFDTRMAAVTIRAAIDAAGYRLGSDPDFDISTYGRGLADFFDHAMRAAEQAPNPEESSS